jgi:hypothetical protein
VVGFVFTVALAFALWVLAALLGRRELRLYRASGEIGTDLFVYTRARLWRRMTGVGVLAALGATLLAFELVGASSPSGLSLYMALLITEVVVLMVLPIFDLWETARTARPQDLTRQGRETRTRKRSRRPR